MLLFLAHRDIVYSGLNSIITPQPN